MSNIVDFDRLQSFTNGDQALETELCGLFLETATRYVDDLAQHRDDPQRWSRTAHSLKGAAGNFGAVAMAELARAAERQEPDAATLDRLQASLAATKAILEQRLP